VPRPEGRGGRAKTISAEPTALSVAARKPHHI
jgi:hypothetical protein